MNCNALLIIFVFPWVVIVQLFLSSVMFYKSFASFQTCLLSCNREFAFDVGELRIFLKISSLQM